MTPRRIVSLVPSVTESLFALGLGERVVGVTDWCVHPARDVAAIPKVGGTKSTDVEAVVALAPDLVIANREENTRRSVERLRAAGLEVWVTYPRSVREGAALLRELAGLGASADSLSRVVAPVEEAGLNGFGEASRPELRGRRRPERRTTFGRLLTQRARSIASGHATGTHDAEPGSDQRMISS